MVRKVVVPWYPTPEVTVFRDFGAFIGFAVLFCPEQVLVRDIKKAFLLCAGRSLRAFEMKEKERRTMSLNES